MLGIVAPGQVLVDRQHSNSGELEALAFESTDHFPHEPPGDTVRLDHYKGVFSHGDKLEPLCVVRAAWCVRRSNESGGDCVWRPASGDRGLFS